MGALWGDWLMQLMGHLSFILRAFLLFLSYILICRRGLSYLFTRTFLYLRAVLHQSLVDAVCGFKGRYDRLYPVAGPVSPISVERLGVWELGAARL